MKKHHIVLVTIWCFFEGQVRTAGCRKATAVTSDFRELRLLPSALGAYAFLVEGDTAEGTALDAGV